jgi:hypothetical protein
MNAMEFSGVFIHLECPDSGGSGGGGDGLRDDNSNRGRRGSAVSIASIASISSNGQSGRRGSTGSIASIASIASIGYGDIRRTGSADSSISSISSVSSISVLSGVSDFSDTESIRRTYSNTSVASNATNCNTIPKYMIFIKFGDDMIFVDITNVGSIIMPFEALMKNKYLQKYYRVSLMSIAEKDLIIEKSYYYEMYNANDIMDIGREWFIDAMYIIEDERTGECEAKNGEYYISCNPYNLKDMYVATDKEIAGFNKLYDDIYGYEKTGFEERLISYATLLLNHTSHLMKLKINYMYPIKEHEH